MTYFVLAVDKLNDEYYLTREKFYYKINRVNKVKI